MKYRFIYHSFEGANSILDVVKTVMSAVAYIGALNIFATGVLNETLPSSWTQEVAILFTFIAYWMTTVNSVMTFVRDPLCSSALSDSNDGIFNVNFAPTYFLIGSAICCVGVFSLPHLNAILIGCLVITGLAANTLIYKLKHN